jgi:hypothetical protein
VRINLEGKNKLSHVEHCAAWLRHGKCGRCSDERDDYRYGIDDTWKWVEVRKVMETKTWQPPLHPPVRMRTDLPWWVQLLNQQLIWASCLATNHVLSSVFSFSNSLWSWQIIRALLCRFCIIPYFTCDMTGTQMKILSYVGQFFCKL